MTPQFTKPLPIHFKSSSLGPARMLAAATGALLLFFAPGFGLGRRLSRLGSRRLRGGLHRWLRRRSRFLRRQPQGREHQANRNRQEGQTKK